MGTIRDDVYAEQGRATSGLHETAERAAAEGRREAGHVVGMLASRWLATLTERHDLEVKALVIGRDVLSNPEDQTPQDAAAALAVDLAQAISMERVALAAYEDAAAGYFVRYQEHYRG